jgi:hypothetical protein
MATENAAASSETCAPGYLTPARLADETCAPAAIHKIASSAEAHMGIATLISNVLVAAKRQEESVQLLGELEKQASSVDGIVKV